jgi:hypothetical protein
VELKTSDLVVCKWCGECLHRLHGDKRWFVMRDHPQVFNPHCPNPTRLHEPDLRDFFHDLLVIEEAWR